MLQVVYAGEESIPPASSAFSNPTVLVLTLTSFINISDPKSGIKSRISMQLEPFDEVDESDPLFQVDFLVLVLADKNLKRT